MGYREDEKRWKRIQDMLAAEASGQTIRPAVSQRTLFGIPSTVEQTIERIVKEDERERWEKRNAHPSNSNPATGQRQPGDSEDSAVS